MSERRARFRAYMHFMNTLIDYLMHAMTRAKRRRARAASKLPAPRGLHDVEPPHAATSCELAARYCRDARTYTHGDMLQEESDGRCHSVFDAISPPMAVHADILNAATMRAAARIRPPRAISMPLSDEGQRGDGRLGTLDARHFRESDAISAARQYFGLTHRAGRRLRYDDGSRTAPPYAQRKTR